MRLQEELIQREEVEKQLEKQVSFCLEIIR